MLDAFGLVESLPSERVKVTHTVYPDTIHRPLHTGGNLLLNFFFDSFDGENTHKRRLPINLFGDEMSVGGGARECANCTAEIGGDERRQRVD